MAAMRLVLSGSAKKYHSRKRSKGWVIFFSSPFFPPCVLARVLCVKHENVPFALTCFVQEEQNMRRPVLTREQMLQKVAEDKSRTEARVVNKLIETCLRMIGEAADKDQHYTYVPYKNKVAGEHALSVFKPQGYRCELQHKLFLAWDMPMATVSLDNGLLTAEQARARQARAHEKLVKEERETVMDTCMAAIEKYMALRASGVGVEIKYEENKEYAAAELRKLGYKTSDGGNSLTIKW